MLPRPSLEEPLALGWAWPVRQSPHSAQLPFLRGFFTFWGFLEDIGIELLLLSMLFLFNEMAVGLASPQKGHRGVGSLEAQS